MWFQQIILVFIAFSLVFGEDSFNHDFGDDFREYFSFETGFCEGFREWIQDNYDTTTVDPPNESLQFVKPDTTYSCMLSNNFSMSHGGELHLSVHLAFASQGDVIRLIAYKSQDNVVVGEITRNNDTNPNSGWNTLNVTIEDSETEGTFDGYVAIIGRATSNSYILVDHIQYVPPFTENESESEEEPCDNETCEPVLMPCIDYDFGVAFGILFNSGQLCVNTGTGTWVQSSINDDISGIKPSVNNTLSCTSSPYISFTEGTLYVVVLIQSDSIFDSISVILNNNQEVYQSVTYGKLTSDEVTSDLYTLEIPVDFAGEAEITFMGIATQGATVLVESFEYIPSLWNNGTCTPLLEARRQVAIADSKM